MIRINEIFGPTIQGEGPNTGRHCVFIRVSRCNLHCEWCDTPYTWAHTPAKAALHNSGHLYDPSKEERELSIEDILKELQGLWDYTKNQTLFVISGGEPMLQQRELEDLVASLLIFGDVEIETAGTITPIVKYPAGTTVSEETYDHPVVSVFGEKTVHYNVSPKLAHSGNTERARRNGDALWQLARLNSDFKFVAQSTDDFEEIELLVEIAEIPKSRIWVMPEGTNVETIREHGRAIVEEVLKRGWNLSLRNHVWLWGEERGK
jgi:7-carboxy-7-deazaguanine synthase